MTSETLYALVGCGVFAFGLTATLTRAHLFWKVLGFNLMGSGIFLILVAAAPRLADEGADPVPQAMVLTGIVVAVSATALALGIALRVARRTGAPFLSEDLAWELDGRGNAGEGGPVVRPRDALRDDARRDEGGREGVSRQ